MPKSHLQIAKDIFGTVLINKQEYFELDEKGLHTFIEEVFNMSASTDTLILLNNAQCAIEDGADIHSTLVELIHALQPINLAEN